MAEQPKAYLGDGIYAEFDGYYTWVYTDNGERKSEKIAFEPESVAALAVFDRECRALLREDHDG